MRIVIAGGHGKIARELTRILAADQHEVVGLIRKPEQSADLMVDGAIPEVVDLESASVDEVAKILKGADAAVFAAGAGPGSGKERKETVDLGAAVLLADAAESAGVERFIQISSMGNDLVRDGAIPEGMDEVFVAYLRAKLAAEEDLKTRGLKWTIVRPGQLTDDAGSGLVRLDLVEERGPVPRADVAAVLAELLRTGAGARQLLNLISGDVPVKDAVAAFA
ncbi:NAD(P)H-binding protein [Arthrobacter crystallopoietes]|jgi:nucleoside-diphosphate-sugar epimerase|nr:NAD(P)H-binding protein [Arthrobacter crystallopoietes]QTG79788.1 NAD(P)H-binding protein [Arthrobacter crystallopoietes]